LANQGEQRLVRKIQARRLGDPKIDDPRHRPAVDLDHQNIGRLEIPMNDRVLVGMLDPLARLEEYLDPFADRQPMAVAIFRDR
jgi:hypothetical protein